MTELLVLPRPDTEYPHIDPIPAPTEEEFTSTFGTLLPSAKYLTTQHGKAAYYLFPPQQPTSEQFQSQSPSQGQGPTRILLIHGVQTPALGLLPLTTTLRTQFPASTFLLLDLWGHGLSQTPRVPHTASLFAGLVDAVLGEVGWKDGQEKVAIVGYSFGSVVGMTFLTDFACRGPNASIEDGEVNKGSVCIHSLTLIAPAGLLKKEWFSDEERELLGRKCKRDDEHRAAEFVVRTLEDGPLTVPLDWEGRVRKGEVVAQAVKSWQMEYHAGHAASVVGVFRDGGVFGNAGLFRRARDTGVRCLVVLGERDGMSSESEITGLGFETRSVEGAGHGVVRERVGEVAGIVGGFWRGM